jgi:hypothetical protein
MIARLEMFCTNKEDIDDALGIDEVQSIRNLTTGFGHEISRGHIVREAK